MSNIKVQVNGKKVALSAKQVARIVALAGNAVTSAPRAVAAPADTHNGLRIGMLVAGSLPKHPRIVVSKIHSFDRDGEARGARGEHLGYAGRRSSNGDRKYTLCTPVSADLARSLVSAFPNLQNDPRPL